MEDKHRCNFFARWSLVGRDIYSALHSDADGL
jgi:hypothetical protein